MGNIIVWLAILGAFGWMGFNYFRIRKAAKFVDNATFEELIRKGQLIDLREPAEFHAKHILGARNIPSTQLKLSLAALRKDKPILLYENSRSSRVTNAALYLKKQGYTVLMIEHDMSVVMNISDRIYVIDHGKPIAEGLPEEIAKNQKVIDVYLGGSNNAAKD